MKLSNLWKVFVVVLVAFAIGLSGTPAGFAMAAKPATKDKNWYLNEPYNACTAYGNPWAPNFKYKVKPNIWSPVDGSPDWALDANGQKVLAPLCSTVMVTTQVEDLYGNIKTVTVPSTQCFDNTKPEYNHTAWRACAKPYWDYASACFVWNTGTKKWDKVANCPVQNPAP